MLSYATMNSTIQLNLRVPKGLLYDMKFISQNLRVNRNEWLKVKVAELIAQEKLSIAEKIETRYSQGRISEEEFRERMGFKPPTELRTSRLRDELTKDKETHRQAASNYLEKALKTTESKK